MIYMLPAFLAVLIFVRYIGLNPLMGVFLGILFALGVNPRFRARSKKNSWLFHVVYIIVFFAMIILLSDYISGEIISVCALWAVFSSLFSYRESLLMIRSNSSDEKK
ncbi:MAG: hypothetical protein COZ15_05045 [Elusimicrobia bacterium CG_4_10_14_3_um_filter_49_12_50_7]|nr:MAG: hypothetical protein COS41_00460 [Elusimicrobia bacterium CG03_land_8_20_14_0_80_50_18]PIX15557.1 MAG: hypothetical protein COZ72_03180 [Elusimicrobia bacterium CG_4_8_14_3_um_filter_50_9]PIY16631.1 MAG: hypothetical protein COZ15_05045 [Elusimicrobia bacterium CG_4_10_14_3_um_filter_49_12_50_7]